jgi:hypothetical protein
MAPKHLLRRIASVLVSALLFAHAVVAFAGCEMPRRAAAAALSEQPCHQAALEANLCLMHCLAEDRSLDRPAVQVPELPAVPVLGMQFFVRPREHLLVPVRFPVPLAAAPPRILFRSLLI